MSADYKAAVSLHEQIEALYPRIDSAKVYFRSPAPPCKEVPLDVRNTRDTPVVDRDRAVCALTIRAANTKKAVKALADAGFSDDAYALARVLMENAATIKWLVQDEGKYRRLDTYCLFVAATKKRYLEMYLKHFPNTAQGAQIPDMDHAIADVTFDGEHLSWAWFPDS